jgi:hypothetical protein
MALINPSARREKLKHRAWAICLRPGALGLMDGDRMAMKNDWDGPSSAGNWSLGVASMGALRITLLFGSAAVAMALILTPIIDRQTNPRGMPGSAMSAGIDQFTTGSIGYRGLYTERRSILQPSPHSVCVIRDNGIRTGDC